jgi:hypothetical protein
MPNFKYSKKDTCATPECPNKPVARGLCRECYNREYQKGKIGVKKRDICRYPKCEDEATVRGMCRKHYNRIYYKSRKAKE